MARGPRPEIDRIKTEISLQRLVEASGVELKRHGAKDLVGGCPFHNDRTPSLVITPATNEWHCMGACDDGGDVIKWVMKTRGGSFTHAIALLKADHPALTATLDRVVRKGTAEKVKLEAPVESDAEDREILRQAVDYYHRTIATGCSFPTAWMRTRTRRRSNRQREASPCCSIKPSGSAKASRPS